MPGGVSMRAFNGLLFWGPQHRKASCVTWELV